MNAVQVRLVEDADLPFVSAHDPHISAAVLQSKSAAREILVATSGDQCVGFLRWGWFWDNTPFMNVLFVVEEARGKGIATQLNSMWEVHMRDSGAEFVLTSTLSNETSQHFYRKCGYQDIGGFALPNEPLELILYKKLE